MHLFCSFHEEKGDCVRLSMGEQPWPELGLHDWRWECSLERGERGKERGKGGHGWGGAWVGAVGEGGGLLLCSVKYYFCKKEKEKENFSKLLNF
jgi:hypothetical protein